MKDFIVPLLVLWVFAALVICVMAGIYMDAQKSYQGETVPETRQW